jgi:hypothetical protein
MLSTLQLIFIFKLKLGLGRHVALASMLPSEPINHGAGFISLVELNASSTSIHPVEPQPCCMIQLQHREKEVKFLRALQVILFCHFWSEPLLPQRCDTPSILVAIPMRLLFTLAVIPLNPLGRKLTVDLGFYIACLIHRYSSPALAKSGEGIPTAKLPTEGVQVQVPGNPDRSAHFVKSWLCTTLLEPEGRGTDQLFRNHETAITGTRSPSDLEWGFRVGN